MLLYDTRIYGADGFGGGCTCRFWHCPHLLLLHIFVPHYIICFSKAICGVLVPADTRAVYPLRVASPSGSLKLLSTSLFKKLVNSNVINFWELKLRVAANPAFVTDKLQLQFYIPDFAPSYLDLLSIKTF